MVLSQRAWSAWALPAHWEASPRSTCQREGSVSGPQEELETWSGSKSYRPVWGKGQPGLTRGLQRSIPNSGWVSGKAVGNLWGMWVTVENGNSSHTCLPRTESLFWKPGRAGEEWPLWEGYTRKPPQSDRAVFHPLADKRVGGLSQCGLARRRQDPVIHAALPGERLVPSDPRLLVLLRPRSSPLL